MITAAATEVAYPASPRSHALARGGPQVLRCDVMVRYPRFDGTQACADLTPPAAAYLPVPPAQANLAAARRRCSGCLFRAACQRYALGHDVQGIWGGLDDRQRRAQRAAAGLPEPRR